MLVHRSLLFVSSTSALRPNRAFPHAHQLSHAACASTSRISAPASLETWASGRRVRPALKTAAYATSTRTRSIRATMTAAAATDAAPGRTIATHDGTFHCDEVLAVHMLRNHVAAFRGGAVVRSRDAAVLDAADIVVDVGAVYDPAKHRYDHHQRGFEATFAGGAPGAKRSRTKLSSAGLIYKHFGREVVSSVLQQRTAKKDKGDDDDDNPQQPQQQMKAQALSEEDVERVYLKVYDSFMEAVDAIDNGVPMFESDAAPRYESSTDLGARVGRCNAEWYEQQPDQDANFRRAMALAGAELDDCIARVARSWLPARSIVARAFAARAHDHASGRVMVMREWAPWKDHLFELEAETQAQVLAQTEEAEGEAEGGKTTGKGLIDYVVYQDVTGKSWRVQCVPVAKASFESRRPLPQAWRGVRDEQLSELTGIPQCIFVHAAGFIGGNKTFEGAMEMVHKALQSSD